MKKKGLLTKRETEVIKLYAEGCMAINIATILGIAETTVTFHRRSAYKKLNALSLAHAVAIAIRKGLI